MNKEQEKNELQREHVKQIKEKPLYGRFWKITEDVCGTKKLGLVEEKNNNRGSCFNSSRSINKIEQLENNS